MRFTMSDIKEVTNKEVACKLTATLANKVNYIVKPRKGDFNQTRWYDLDEAIVYFSRTLEGNNSRYNRIRQQYLQILFKVRENLDYAKGE